MYFICTNNGINDNKSRFKTNLLQCSVFIYSSNNSHDSKLRYKQDLKKTRNSWQSFFLCWNRVSDTKITLH